MKHKNPSAPYPNKVPLRIYRTGTLSLEGLILNGSEPQPGGHPTDGYSLAMLTKDPDTKYGLLLYPISPDPKGNYDLEQVPEKFILMWTPVHGTAPDYGAVVEISPNELVYVPADSPEHAWEILGFDQE